VTEPIDLRFTVDCSPQHAFAVWTQRTSLWWPKSHSVSQHPQLDVRFEPYVDGRIVERTPSGDEHVWGRVTIWQPPRRVAYRWHLRQDPADATEVEITFDAAADGRTNVHIVHRGFERLGERSASLRDRNHAGWAGLLPHYTAACAAPTTATDPERSTP
jgi:uncharacterized protein YndB with AHSA1/START domain